MLGIKHIIYIIIVFLITYMFHKLIKSNIIKFEKFLKCSAILSMFLDPVYWVWEYLEYGYLDYSTTFPLYMCSLFWFLMPIVAFSRKKGFLYRVSLSCLCTIVYYGAFLGLLLNSHLNEHSFWHFIVQRSLFYHFLMFLVISLIWSSGHYRVEKKDRFLFMLPLLILMIPAYIVDKKYGYDYCYFNGGVGTVLEYFSDFLGKPLFLILLYLTIFSSLSIFLGFVYKFQNKKRM